MNRAVLSTTLRRAALAWAACGGAALAGHPPLFFNGPIGTGGTTSEGIAAPQGAAWSELPTPLSSVQGFAMESGNATRVADDFVVSDRDGWVLREVVIYAYQPGSGTAESPFTSVTLRIWNGRPGEPESQAIWTGVTSQEVRGEFTGLLRTDSRGTVARPVYSIVVPAAVTLSQGTYWLEWSASGRLSSGVWCPAVTVPGQRSAPGANAVQYIGGEWRAAVEGTPGPLGPAFAQDFPFIIHGHVVGTSALCYANCDASTGAAFLNAADFTCFLERFAAGSPYANCNGSTSAPALTVSDLTCFIGAFAAGCSAP